MSKAAAIYARISRDEAGESLGVDRQVRLCRELAETRGLDVVEVLTDNDVSAYGTRRRPAFEHLVELLRSGQADAVVAYHADRLYRRTTDLERLVDVVEACGAQVHTVAAGIVDLGTASGRMVARMLGAAAQHESERMGERLRAKSDELARNGRAPGGRPPYGYRWEPVPDGNGGLRRCYVPDLAEVEALHYMARRVLEGASLLGIARELDADGIRTRQGRPWHSSTVRASLVNPAVAGLRVHRREVAGPGEWPAVIDRSTWEEVRATLTDPARRRTRPANDYLLSGLVHTPAGDRMNGCINHQGHRSYRARYPAKQWLSIPAEQLEVVVVAAVLDTLDTVALPSPDDRPSDSDEVATLEAELAELAKLRGAGTISMGEWLAARAPLQARLEAAARSTKPSTKVGRLLARPGAARRAWPDLDTQARREVVAAMVEAVTVGPAVRGRWTTIAERLDPDAGFGIVWRA